MVWLGAWPRKEAEIGLLDMVPWMGRWLERSFLVKQEAGTGLARREEGRLEVEVRGRLLMRGEEGREGEL